MSTRSVLGFQILRLRPPLNRRIGQLLPGLTLFGIASAFTVAADLGSNPWTVFAQGLAETFGLSVGTWVVLVGAALLLLFAPIREPLGLGTLLNVLIIGPVVDLTLWVVGEPESIFPRIILLGLAPPILGLASGLYIGAGLGPGPRDGLMTALSRRGLKVSTARTLIELSALAAGWVLGGVVGIGTVYFAVTVGWWIRLFLPRLEVPDAALAPAH